MPQEHRILFPHIEKKCKHCGIEFLAKMSNRVFCSGSCRVLYYRRDNKINYKERYLKYQEYSSKYSKTNNKEAKEFLVSKLGDKCVICGKPKRVFHEIHNRPHKTLTLNQAKKLWQNFVPMCDNCHKTLHRFLKYKEKFEKFLSMVKLNKPLNSTLASILLREKE